MQSTGTLESYKLPRGKLKCIYFYAKKNLKMCNAKHLWFHWGTGNWEPTLNKRTLKDFLKELAFELHLKDTSISVGSEVNSPWESAWHKPQIQASHGVWGPSEWVNGKASQEKNTVESEAGQLRWGQVIGTDFEFHPIGGNKQSPKDLEKGYFVFSEPTWGGGMKARSMWGVSEL